MDAYEELARRAGLMLDDLGRKAIERIDLAGADALERAVEALAVPETWFFRDVEPFVHLAQFAASAPRPLRVLSAPCSTGEEPYSVAITLLEAGLPPEAFEIDAVDISASALAAAGRAVYGKGSFRHPMAGLVEKYFRRTEQGLQLRADIAGLVRFRRANLLAPLGPAALYHAIFCRNLLIYLHEEARRRVIALMRELLADEGVLFAGPSEVVLFLAAGFTKVPRPRSFACQKSIPCARARPAAPPAVVPVTERKRAEAALAKPQPEAQLGLQDARRLADRGRFAEAAAICKGLGPSAEAFCLLGLISQTKDRLAEAEEYFRKALYLDPRHGEALLHMSLLCESRGDAARGSIFRNRATRAGAGGRS